MYGEGTEAQGEFFQISNQLTLGLKEEEIIDHVQRVTHQVVEQEKRAREALLKRNGLQIRNEVGRAYGVLTGAYLISSQEALDLLSKLRLGISLKLLPGLNIGILNELFFLITPAQLQIRKGRELAFLSRDELRAKLIRGKLSKVR